MIKFRTTFQFRLLVFVAMVIIATLTFIYYVSVENQRKIFNDSFHDAAINLANALDAGIASTNDLLDVEKLQSNIYKLLWLNSNIVGISISLPHEGNILIVASNDTNSIGQHAPPDGLTSIRDGTISVHEITQSDGTSLLRVITPVHVGGKRVGIYTILLSRDALVNVLAKTQREFLIIALVSIFIVIGIFSLLLKRTNDLYRSKTHMETIIDNLADGLIEFSASGEVKRVNHAALRLLGDAKENAVATLVANSEKKERLDLEISQPLTMNLQIVTAPLPASLGPDAGYVSIIRDVTREKLIDQDKSSFISVAAHQMRTPLSATKWALAALLEDHASELTPRMKEIVKIGATTNDRMIGLVNDLLVVSRIEDGRYGYTFIDNDLCELIEITGTEYAPIVAKHSLTYSSVCPPDLPHLRFDVTKLSIALHNLIDNAILYTKPGGHISVSVSAENGQAVIRIADTGIGIPHDGMSKLFTKFYRAENAILTSPDGSGLGLFIVKNIIMQHEGTIEASPNDPQGTVFTIKLPLQSTSPKLS